MNNHRHLIHARIIGNNVSEQSDLSDYLKGNLDVVIKLCNRPLGNIKLIVYLQRFMILYCRPYNVRQHILWIIWTIEACTFHVRFHRMVGHLSLWKRGFHLVDRITDTMSHNGYIAATTRLNSKVLSLVNVCKFLKAQLANIWGKNSTFNVM